MLFSGSKSLSIPGGAEEEKAFPPSLPKKDSSSLLQNYG
jgi:hypothetical protein